MSRWRSPVLRRSTLPGSPPSIQCAWRDRFVRNGIEGHAQIRRVIDAVAFIRILELDRALRHRAVHDRVRKTVHLRAARRDVPAEVGVHRSRRSDERDVAGRRGIDRRGRHVEVPPVVARKDGQRARNGAAERAGRGSDETAERGDRRERHEQKPKPIQRGIHDRRRKGCATAIWQNCAALRERASQILSPKAAVLGDGGNLKSQGLKADQTSDFRFQISDFRLPEGPP